MQVCQRQRRHLWESIRDWLLVPPFTRAFLKSPSSRGLSAIAELLVSSTFKALNLGEKIQVLSRPFKDAWEPCLKKSNWNWLFSMQSGSEMVEGLYSAIVALLDKYSPVTEHEVYSSDKPSATPSFKWLIRCRQYAFKVCKVIEYRRLRNQIQKVDKKLWRNYYKSKVDHLYSADQRSWWWKLKDFWTCLMVILFIIYSNS